MASLTIADIDETVRHRLHALATRHGRSIEEEAHAILGAALDSTRSHTVHAQALSLIADVRARCGPLKTAVATPASAPGGPDNGSLLAAGQEA